jgi:hypothetical protein
MFHANDQHAPHWSEDFVEHIRTVHFALIAACLTLIGLVQFGKPTDVATATYQLQDIRSAVGSWNSREALNAVRHVLYQAAGRSFSGWAEILIDRSRAGNNGVVLTSAPLVSVQGKQSISESAFIDSFKRQQPTSLGEFRDFWNLLDKQITVFAPDKSKIGTRVVVLKKDGTAATVGYKFMESSTIAPSGKEPAYATFRRTRDSEQDALFKQLHREHILYVYSFDVGEDTGLLPVEPGPETEVDGQGAFIQLHKYWKRGDFATTFRELNEATAGMQDKPFGLIDQHLAEVAAKPKAESFEVFGVKLPVETASRWGISLIVGIQLYL